MSFCSALPNEVYEMFTKYSMYSIYIYMGVYYPQEESENIVTEVY